MSFRAWFSKKLLGFDAEEYRQKLDLLTDEMSTRVANMIIAKESLSIEIQAIKTLDPPSEDWYMAVQNAIQILDERTKDMADYISSHEEALEHIFSKDDSTILTQWGPISTDNKDLN